MAAERLTFTNYSEIHELELFSSRRSPPAGSIIISIPAINNPRDSDNYPFLRLVATIVLFSDGTKMFSKFSLANVSKIELALILLSLNFHNCSPLIYFKRRNVLNELSNKVHVKIHLKINQRITLDMDLIIKL